MIRAEINLPKTNMIKKKTTSTKEEITRTLMTMTKKKIRLILSPQSTKAPAQEIQDAKRELERGTQEPMIKTIQQVHIQRDSLFHKIEADHSCGYSLKNKIPLKRMMRPMTLPITA